VHPYNYVSAVTLTGSIDNSSSCRCVEVGSG